MDFLQTLFSMLSIVIMIAVGVLITKLGWIKEDGKDLLMKLTVQVSLPCLIFESILSDFNKSNLISMSSDLILPFLSTLFSMVLGILTANLLHIPKGKKGIFISIFFNSNTVYMGLPVNMAINGEASVPYVMLYYIVSIVFFWTFGIYFIASDASDGKKRSLFSLQTIKDLFSLPLISFLIALFLLMMNVHVPAIIFDTMRYLGNLTTPLSMLFIGACICTAPLEQIRSGKEILGALLGRFAAAPVIMISLLFFFPTNRLAGKVYLIQAVMPVMANTAILARSYHCDEDYASVVTVMSTVLSVIVVPIYCFLYDVLFC